MLKHFKQIEKCISSGIIHMYLYSHISIYTHEIVFIRKPISQNNVYFKSYFLAKTE